MFSIKSEPSDTVDVGRNSQSIGLMDSNPRINDPINMDTSDDWPDKRHRKEIILTVAYIKTEPSTSASQYNTSNYEGNLSIHEQSFIKTEKKEEGTDVTSRHMTAEEIDTMYAKEKSQYDLIEDHEINYTTDLSQYNRIGNSDVLHNGHTGITSLEHLKGNTMINTKEKPYKCDAFGYRATRSPYLKYHK